MADTTLEALERVETILNSILGIQVDQFLRDSGVGKPRPRSIDRMLADFGLSGVQIAALLGKTRQAVSQALAKDDKAAKASSAKVTPEAGAPHA
jgi:hypothetical protein